MYNIQFAGRGFTVVGDSIRNSPKFVTNGRRTDKQKQTCPLRASLGHGELRSLTGPPDRKKSSWGITGPLRHGWARCSLPPYPPSRRHWKQGNSIYCCSIASRGKNVLFASGS